MKTIKLTRRHFLQVGGSSLAGAALFSGNGKAEPLQTPGSGETGYGPFKIGFQSYSLRRFRDLGSFVAETRKLGLGYVELYSGHLSPEASDEEIQSVKGKLAEAGIVMNAFGVERFSADHEANRRLFEFGRKLGIRNLSANPSPDAFDSLDRLVREYDIRIAIHNHGPADERWGRPEWILKAVQDRDRRIGACVDTGHYLRADVDPVEAIRMLGRRVLGVHLKDFDRDQKETLVGQGRLDLNATLLALKEIGLVEPLSLEYEDHPQDPVPHMREGLETVRRVIAAWA